MRSRQRFLPLAASLTVILLGAACGSGDSEDVTPPPADPLAAGTATDEASFTVVVYHGEDLLGGSEITFDSILGHGTPVVLNFWAAQCPPCLVEMPWFQAAYQQHADSVLLVGLDVGQFTGLGTTEQGAELLADLKITYPAGYAVDDVPLRRFDVTNMPFTVFFDAAGEAVGNHAGIMTERQIQDWFANLSAGTVRKRP